jgi:PKD repeat protein
VYTVAGVYEVSLTAVNAIGSDTLTKTSYIQVLESPYGIFPNCIAPAIGIETHSWWHENGEAAPRHVHMGACVPNARDNSGSILTVRGVLPVVQRVVSYNNPGELTMVRYQWESDTIFQHNINPHMQCQTSPDEFKECFWYFQMYIDTSVMNATGHDELRMTPNFVHPDLGTRQYNSLNFEVHRGGSKNYRPGPEPQNRAWYTGMDYVNARWVNYMDYFTSVNQTMPTISGIIDVSVSHDKCSGDTNQSVGYVDPPFHAFHAGKADEPIPFYSFGTCFRGVVQLDTRQFTNGVHVIYLQSQETDSRGLNAGAGAYRVNIQNSGGPSPTVSQANLQAVVPGTVVAGEFVRLDSAEFVSGAEQMVTLSGEFIDPLALPDDKSWIAQQAEQVTNGWQSLWGQLQSWFSSSS